MQNEISLPIALRYSLIPRHFKTHLLNHLTVRFGQLALCREIIADKN